LASRRVVPTGGVEDAEATAVHDTTATRRTADLVDEATVPRYLRTRWKLRRARHGAAVIWWSSSSPSRREFPSSEFPYFDGA